MSLPSGESPVPELHLLVESKLVKVFGEPKARALLTQVLTELELVRVASLGDLTRVAESLQRRGGFEATLGAMFAVDAAMRRINER